MSLDYFTILTADGRVRDSGARPRPELTKIVAMAPALALRNDGVVFSWHVGSTNPAPPTPRRLLRTPRLWFCNPTAQSPHGATTFMTKPMFLWD
jgi:hypothetical protein